jgi:hypothetical protein
LINPLEQKYACVDDSRKKWLPLLIRSTNYTWIHFLAMSSHVMHDTSKIENETLRERLEALERENEALRQQLEGAISDEKFVSPF